MVDVSQSTNAASFVFQLHTRQFLQSERQGHPTGKNRALLSVEAALTGSAHAAPRDHGSTAGEGSQRWGLSPRVMKMTTAMRLRYSRSTLLQAARPKHFEVETVQSVSRSRSKNCTCRYPGEVPKKKFKVLSPNVSLVRPDL